MEEIEYVGIPLPREEYPLEFSKIGGIPMGMSADRWPSCGECGRPMDFYFSLDLCDPKPIAKKYRYALFFFCDVRNGTCSPYYPWGANRIVLLEQPDATSPFKYLGQTERPEFTIGYYDTTDWEEQKASDQQAFDDAILNPQFDEEGTASIPIPALNDEMRAISLLNAPEWIQNDETPSCPQCNGPMKFIGQAEGKAFHLGVAYAFLCEQECCAEGSYLMYQVD